MRLITNLRYWLIKKLSGKDAIAINLTLAGYLSMKDQNCFSYNCIFISEKTFLPEPMRDLEMVENTRSFFICKKDDLCL